MLSEQLVQQIVAKTFQFALDTTLAGAQLGDGGEQVGLTADGPWIAGMHVPTLILGVFMGAVPVLAMFTLKKARGMAMKAAIAAAVIGVGVVGFKQWKEQNAADGKEVAMPWEQAQQAAEQMEGRIKSQQDELNKILGEN